MSKITFENESNIRRRSELNKVSLPNCGVHPMTQAEVKS